MMFKNKLWWVLIPVIAASVIGWGAWATVTATGATPREVFDRHVEDAQDKYDHAQDRIEDKLDEIQKTILDLHK
jgi:hypothetical protein